MEALYDYIEFNEYWDEDCLISEPDFEIDPTGEPLDFVEDYEPAEHDSEFDELGFNPYCGCYDYDC